MKKNVCLSIVNPYFTIHVYVVIFLIVCSLLCVEENLRTYFWFYCLFRSFFAVDIQLTRTGAVCSITISREVSHVTGLYRYISCHEIVYRYIMFGRGICEKHQSRDEIFPEPKGEGNLVSRLFFFRKYPSQAWYICLITPNII
jgi:hypothetical protein